jgi:hypothetical protein
MGFSLLLCWTGALVSALLHTSSNQILDETDSPVKFKCVNWAGHLEINIPEGLQHQSVDYIASWIAANKFNCVRLTYSIDMALGPTQPVADSFAAAGPKTGNTVAAMQTLYGQAVAANPFLANASLIETYSVVIDTLHAKGIMTILDNHVSRASWCCNFTDGNGWFAQGSGYVAENSRFFDVPNWLAGLSAMATYASAHPGVVALSLRNEMRPIPVIQDTPNEADWYKYVGQGAAAIHAANPDVLIVIGGVDGAENLATLATQPLDTSGWPNRTVWEFHAYTFSVLYGYNKLPCFLTKILMDTYAGYLLEPGHPYTGPLWLSEFGMGLTGGPNNGLSDADASYLSCLVEYMEGKNAGWAYWALMGSYYVRDGTINLDEGYGLLDTQWSGWKNAQFPSLLGTMWND